MSLEEFEESFILDFLIFFVDIFSVEAVSSEHEARTKLNDDRRTKADTIDIFTFNSRLDSIAALLALSP